MLLVQRQGQKVVKRVIPHRPPDSGLVAQVGQVVGNDDNVLNATAAVFRQIEPVPNNDGVVGVAELLLGEKAANVLAVKHRLANGPPQH